MLGPQLRSISARPDPVAIGLAANQNLLMKSFVHHGLASRVVFGRGALARLPEEVARLGATRALVLCTPGRRALADDIAGRLGAVGVYDAARMHVPVETAEAARAVASSLVADVCVAVGGGSVVGLGKAIALDAGLPIVAVPTTFAGSEATPIYGLTEAGLKRTGRDARVLPKVVIYDPELLVDLPVKIAAASGMNALAHAVEALYAKDWSPIVSLMAEESIRALSRSLPKVVSEPGEVEHWANALYGAWLAGSCLGMVGMGLHHKLCHTLGGSFGLPHAETHAIVLPHAVAYNRVAAREAMDRIAQALGAADAADGLCDLASRIGAPMALKDIGMPEDGLERAAELASQQQYDNPRPLERDALLQLLRDAYAGRRPSA